MSKVISFSISDRYLDKIRSLYPELTDNLAAKQFLTDRLDAGLSSSLDASLDDGLDGKLETMIQTRLDGLLDERLDATVGKLISSLSERMARLEARLDDSLDGRLDDMEPLLRLQREASIATSPLPPSPDEPVQPAIKSLPTVETVSTDSSIETGTGAIETAIKPTIGDEPAIEVPSAKKKGLTDSELARHLGIDKSNITRWKQKGEPTQKYRETWELRGRFWHEKD